MDVIDDIIDKIKLNGYDIFLPVLKELKDFDYDKKYVNSFGAMGDCHKYTVEYVIGDFEFKYNHLTSDGQIVSGKCKITFDNKTSTYLNMSMFGNNNVDYEIFDMFSEKYNLDKKAAITLIDILNSFTLGDAIFVTEDDQLGYTHISNILEHL